jgi:hypothetical protein
MDFPQIMGRQRLKENVFRDECIFIYKLSDVEVTVDEFEKRSKEKLDRTTQDISNYQSLLKSQGILGVNRLISDYRLRIRAKQYKEDYTGINEKTGEPIINRLVYISERRAFELRSDVYKNEVQVYNEFAKIMSPISREFQLEKEIQLNDLKLRFRSKGSFEDKMRDHCDVLLSPKWFGYIHISDFHWLPLDYRNYLNSLGPIRIKEINCREKEILREINNLCQSNPIKNLFIESFQLGSRFTLKSIKEIVRKIYNELGVIKTPKATDILEYFEVKPVFIYDSLTKKQTKGYEILKIKE